MRFCSRIGLRALALLLLTGGATLAADTDDAGHNPFARPARVSGTIPLPSSEPNAPTFELRATLAAGAGSLVNIDGRIIALGDVFAGYRLIAVGEGNAVFARNDVLYPLTIREIRVDRK